MRLKAGTTRREALHVCAGAAAVPLLGMVAARPAETDYPARPVRVIVPYPAGGGADTVSRILLAKLSDGLGQQFVIENRGGAGGTIGAAVAAKAERDGYTVLYDATAFSVNPSLYARLPYDTLNDFQPVFLASLVPNLLVVHPSVEAKTVEDVCGRMKHGWEHGWSSDLRDQFRDVMGEIAEIGRLIGRRARKNPRAGSAS